MEVSDGGPATKHAPTDIRMAVQLAPALARQKVAGPGEGVALPAEPTMSTALYNASYAEFSAGECSLRYRGQIA